MVLSKPTVIAGVAIPQQPQRQDSLDDQLRDVVWLAARVGCYDAADLIWRQFFPEEMQR